MEQGFGLFWGVQRCLLAGLVANPSVEVTSVGLP